MKIYVVTKGEYSAYHIITATTDEKLAHEIAAKYSDPESDWSWGQAHVEEYEDAEKHLLPLFYVDIIDDGGHSVCESLEAEESEFTYYFEKKRLFHTGVFADSPEKALKIASERRTMYLAEKNGLA